jgi:hypothetical protein
LVVAAGPHFLLGIYGIVGRWRRIRIVSFWTEDCGISRDVSPFEEKQSSK